MQELYLTNTLSGKKELFVPQKNNELKLYVCGITPYDFAHIGHGRCYVVYDLLLRNARFAGYDVTYVRNFTDIDDKIINRAEKELGSPFLYASIAEQYAQAFTEDVERLGCLRPQHEPRVTETIAEIIAFVQGLIERKKAYAAEGDVYFAVRQFPSYGALSGRDVNELCSGARVEINTLKQDPLDFALWKSENPGTYWQSPWGAGRPGWHIECSAMSEKFLGKTIDIHGGGMDLIFPHHENERAQSEAYFEDIFVRMWMHVAFVRINKEKMSKSLGNFFTLRDVFKQFDPMVLRYYYATHHYTIPMDFSFDDLTAAQTTYTRLTRMFDGVSVVAVDPLAVTQQIIRRMIDAMLDDLNTSACMAAVFEHTKDIARDPHLAAQVKWLLQELIGLSLEPLAQESVEITPEIQTLINEREAARAARDFARADALRDQLKALGIELSDGSLKK
jgi:cysteinyl-tRNA synthetase